MKAEIGMDVDGKPFLVVIAGSQTECTMLAFAAKALGLGYDCTDGSAVQYAKPEMSEAERILGPWALGGVMKPEATP